MLGDIFEGAVRFGASYVGGKKRLEEQKQAQAGYDQAMAQYMAQDVSNPYANMENVYEDLTVNQQAAQFQAQQQQQGLANTMGALQGAAGGSGIAALAQSLAQQQAANAQAASASIGMQESQIQQMQARESGRIQMAERQGNIYSRELQADLLETQFGVKAEELSAARQAIQDAKLARTEGIGQIAGGVGNLGEAWLAGANTETLGKLGNLGIGLGAIKRGLNNGE